MGLDSISDQIVLISEIMSQEKMPHTNQSEMSSVVFENCKQSDFCQDCLLLQYPASMFGVLIIIIIPLALLAILKSVLKTTADRVYPKRLD